MIDRVIQQAVLQRLQPQSDLTFSEHSFGFRPGRSAHQAVAQAQAYVIASVQALWHLIQDVGGLVTQQRCSRVVGHTSPSAFQNPSAPLAAAI